MIQRADRQDAQDGRGPNHSGGDAADRAISAGGDDDLRASAGRAGRRRWILSLLQDDDLRVAPRCAEQCSNVRFLARPVTAGRRIPQNGDDGRSQSTIIGSHRRTIGIPR